MEKKRRKLLLSCVMILLCILLLTAGSYALFSDSVILQNHLEAGDLDITLTRTKLEVKELGADGFLHSVTNTNPVDFSDGSSDTKNLFDLDGQTYIVPQSEYIATLVIENNETKSNVAFGYWIEIIIDEDSSSVLAEQLLVSVTTAKGTKTGYLTDMFFGAENDFLGVLAVSEEAEFSISVLFEDDDSKNNDAMSKTVYFDIKVHAIQVTENPNA